MLEAQGIQKSFGHLQILKGVDLSVQKGEIITIVGPSGAGKSTFLHIIGTLEKPDAGILKMNGKPIAGLKGNALSRFRNEHIGFIFQFHHLLPEFTALENVCIPAYIGGRDQRQTEQQGKELLEMLGLSHRIDHKPQELSGGEQQRVAVARALINQPSLILADEPSGNLDSRNAYELNQLFLKLRHDFGQTFIIVTHNEDLANIGDRKIHMRDGKIEE